MSNLELLKKEANRRAGLERQQMFKKKAVVRQTDTQIIEMLCERANEVLEAYYKDMGEAVLRERMRALQGGVAIAGKRVRS